MTEGRAGKAYSWKELSPEARERSVEHLLAPRLAFALTLSPGSKMKYLETECTRDAIIKMIETHRMTFTEEGFPITEVDNG